MQYPPRLFLAAGTSLFLGVPLAAQITVINSAPFGPKFATTTGRAHRIDTTNFKLGKASVLRTAAAANQSYLPTGIALDPNSRGRLCPKADVGYTIQFWYRPAAPTTFQYLFGDLTWLGASGAFRCFQNGSAGTGNLRIRGPLGQLTTTGAPLTSAVGPKGWVHVAVVQNNKQGTLTWYINGKQNVSGQSTGTTKGKNFSCVGYNGSASAGVTGNFDQFRVYNRARTAADIAADYQKLAAGSGPSGCLNLPDVGYYRFESSVNPHIGKNTINSEVSGPFTRLFTLGDTLSWSGESPATGPFAAICLMNVFGGGPGSPRIDAYRQPPPLPGGPYRTAFLPGLVLGAPFSTPALPTSLFWPVPVVYGGTRVGKTGFKVPNLPFKNGDRIDLQWIVIDRTFPPAGFGTTNNLTFEYVTPGPAHSVHVEARGVNTIQDTGFWEVWNKGKVAIKEVCIDLSTVPTSIAWDVAGALNSGGTLAAGTSIRFKTDAICDLIPKTNPRYTLTNGNSKLCFKFTCPPTTSGGFQGPTNHYIFDCDTRPTGSGARYIGATVTVTFCNNRVLSGKFVADPKDTNAAQVDL